MSGLFAEQASAFATSDRAEHAAQLLDIACQDAIAILRAGIQHDDQQARIDAALALARAQRRASRVLGPLREQEAS